ncbi:MAG: glycosyltransferase [Proteobacteria bacterium]|nr:glycosyltransferase [Pseudomonadota bacterium]
MSEMRILHVVGRMGQGGAETWLMNVLRHIDRDRFHFDFLVHRTRPGEFDDEIRSLGSAIHIIDSYRNPPRYAAALLSLLARHPCHAIHSHVNFYSGYILGLAKLLGIPGRIAHSHTNVPTAGDSPWRTVYRHTMRAALHATATCGLGTSSAAVRALFGPDWQTWGKYAVLPIGYDFARFAHIGPETRTATRRALGLADSHVVIGHIGRFVPAKNHEFLVDLARASQARGRRDHRFVLVGDGERRSDIERAVHARGLAHSCLFTGQRRDIAELLSAFDVLVLPSLWEGFGIVVLEAQAAGLPCVISDRVSGEVIVRDDLVVRRPLGRVDAWLDALDEMRARRVSSPERAWTVMAASQFGIERHVQRIECIYTSELARTTA